MYVQQFVVVGAILTSGVDNVVPGVFGCVGFVVVGISM